MNILFMLADQLRADFLSCYGARFIHTKHIDSLCQGGVMYRRAVSPSPLCVPARACLLTGLSAIKNGVLENGYWLRPDRAACGIKTWPERLAEHGYYTAAIGKMHFYPWDATEGFAHRVIAEDKRHIHIADDYARYLVQHGLRKLHGNEHEGYFEHKGAIVSRIPAEHQVDMWVADETCAFLEGYEDDRPFALMVGFPGPHCPYDPPPELAALFSPEDMPDSIPGTADSEAFREHFIAIYKREWNQVDYTEFNEWQKRRIRAHYAGLVYQIDRGVGRILETLTRCGLAGDTLVIFASDHGDYLGDYDLMGKHTFYEPSVRVPLIIKLPGMQQGAIVESTVSLTDLTATLLAHAGVDAAPTNDSQLLLALGLSGAQSRPYVFGATDLGFMVTDDEWKLCRYWNGKTTLFNVKNDPLEQHNVAYQPFHLSEMQRLDAIMQQETIEAIRVGHDEKRVDTDGALGSGAFGQPGWCRSYPARLCAKA